MIIFSIELSYNNVEITTKIKWQTTTFRFTVFKEKELL